MKGCPRNSKRTEWGRRAGQVGKGIFYFSKGNRVLGIPPMYFVIYFSSVDPQLLSGPSGFLSFPITYSGFQERQSGFGGGGVISHWLVECVQSPVGRGK